MRASKKTMARLRFLLLALGAVFAACLIILLMRPAPTVPEAADELTVPSRPTSTPLSASAPAPESSPPAQTPEAAGRAIDFDALAAQNPDVIGWLEIPGTDIDYPIVKYKEGEFYLYHGFHGEKDAHGAIFMDARNDADFGQTHVVIYGHNMKDGSMFAGLHKYRELQFFLQNRLIKIYTPEGRLDYTVFAAYERDDRYILNTYARMDKQAYVGYLDEIRRITDEGAHIDMESVSAQSSILTLSTCVMGHDELRYIVQAERIFP